MCNQGPDINFLGFPRKLDPRGVFYRLSPTTHSKIHGHSHIKSPHLLCWKIRKMNHLSNFKKSRVRKKLRQ